MQQRNQIINNFLMNYFQNNNFLINSLKGDASLRIYYRVSSKNKNYILMDSKHDNSYLQFIKILYLLQKNFINVPKIIYQNDDEKILLISDFGNTTINDYLKTKIDMNIYKIAIDKLVLMQKINLNKEELPKYDDKLLLDEMLLFTNWYLPYYASIKISKNKKEQIVLLFLSIINEIKKQKFTFVHRDYHSRNIMLLDNYQDEKVAILDFQDAVIGPYSYDLVSLLKDAYVELNNTQINYLLKYYSKCANVNISILVKDFYIMAIQRFLKVLGIFTRLFHRDNKKNYLYYIPLVNKYLRSTMQYYPKLKLLDDLLTK